MRSAPLVLIAALSSTAAAAPTVTATAGGVVCEEPGLVGGSVGVRVGLRTSAEGPAWGGYTEAAFVRFAGFGPHTGATAYRAAVGVERRLGGDALRPHLVAGVALARWDRATEHDDLLDLTTLGPTAGAGVTMGWVRLDLTATLPVVELARAMTSATVGPELTLSVGVGMP